jgi:hypothetical protein
MSKVKDFFFALKKEKDGSVYMSRLIYANLIRNATDPKLVELILNKPPTPPEDLVGDDKDIVYTIPSTMTRRSTPNGGFSIGTNVSYYGIRDVIKNKDIDDKLLVYQKNHTRNLITVIKKNKTA